MPHFLCGHHAWLRLFVLGHTTASIRGQGCGHTRLHGESVTDSDNTTAKIGIGVMKTLENAINCHDFDIVLLGCNGEVSGAAENFFGIGAIGQINFLVCLGEHIQ